MSFSLGGFINDHILGGSSPSPRATLTGAPQAGAHLVQNPDGTATDQISGQTYAIQPGGGYTAVINPSTAQQVGTDQNAAQGFYGQVPGYNQREAGAYGQEQSLANSLNNMAMGQGPTVAGQQMQVGMDQAARTQLAAASGSTGSGAALSRLAAMNNTAQAQMNVNQQAGVQRAAESTNALNSLAGVTNNMQQQSQGMAGQQLSAAQNLNALALNGEENHEQDVSGVNKNNANNNLSAGTLGVNMLANGVKGGGALS